MITGLSADRQWFIYTLSDPRTGEVRYVGWTVDVARRLYLHIWHSTRRWEKHRYKSRWIRSLTKLGISPTIAVIEDGHGDGWKFAEPKWIAYYRAAGCRLTNLTDGGEGTPGIVVKESTRKLISANGKGKGNWRKGLAIALEKNRGRKHTPEHIAKSVAARRGWKMSDEQKAQISKTHRGLKASPETKALLSAIRKGRTLSEETKQAFSEAQFKRWADARASLKPGEQPSWKGMKRTPEQSKRISTARHPGFYEQKAALESMQGRLF